VKVADIQFKAWGETRSSTGTTPTDYQFTGQRNESGIGLYYYNARWYDASLGRFAQADTVIPGGVQGYDRYAYVNNSPMNGTDPSGYDAINIPWGLVLPAAGVALATPGVGEALLIIGIFAVITVAITVAVAATVNEMGPKNPYVPKYPGPVDVKIPNPPNPDPKHRPDKYDPVTQAESGGSHGIGNAKNVPTVIKIILAGALATWAGVSEPDPGQKQENIDINIPKAAPEDEFPIDTDVKLTNPVPTFQPNPGPLTPTPL
jgi:RHS repeat-associated protein